MQCVGRDTLGHLGFCLHEMLAEIDDQLQRLDIVRALAQLDAREACGEMLEAVCGKALRQNLERQVAEHRLTRAKAKLVELQGVLDPNAPESVPVAVVPAATVQATPVAADVADLAVYRASKAEKTAAKTTRSAVAGVARVVLAAGLLALGGLGSASYVGQSVRLPGFDISVSAIPTPAATSRTGLASSY